MVPAADSPESDESFNTGIFCMRIGFEPVESPDFDTSLDARAATNPPEDGAAPAGGGGGNCGAPTTAVAMAEEVDDDDEEEFSVPTLV